MNALFAAAKEVCDFMTERRWKFCLIGGLAVQRWGQPRTTLDADLTLITGFGEERGFVEPILERFPSRIPDPEEFAETSRVVLIRASNGTDVDISLGALPFEEEMVRRARPIEFAQGISLPCCTAEDLIVMKAFAGRPQDWMDCEGVIARQTTLERAHILDALRNLCEPEEAEKIERVEELLRNKR